jgi:hypothetical protein
MIEVTLPLPRDADAVPVEPVLQALPAPRVASTQAR